MENNDVKNLFRIGTVTSVDETTQRVRVTFTDLDNTTSNWLQVAPWGAYQDDCYWMPDVEEQVFCVFMPTGNAEGYVLFSVRDETHVPKAGKTGKRYIRFSDGAVVEYDRNSSAMTITTPGTITINASSGDVVVGGISLTKHTHGGIEPGGGSTGVPK